MKLPFNVTIVHRGNGEIDVKSSFNLVIERVQTVRESKVFENQGKLFREELQETYYEEGGKPQIPEEDYRLTINVDPVGSKGATQDPEEERQLIEEQLEESNLSENVKGVYLEEGADERDESSKAVNRRARGIPKRKKWRCNGTCHMLHKHDEPQFRNIKTSEGPYCFTRYQDVKKTYGEGGDQDA